MLGNRPGVVACFRVVGEAAQPQVGSASRLQRQWKRFGRVRVARDKPECDRGISLERYGVPAQRNQQAPLLDDFSLCAINGHPAATEHQCSADSCKGDRHQDQEWPHEGRHLIRVVHRDDAEKYQEEEHARAEERKSEHRQTAAAFLNPEAVWRDELDGPVHCHSYRMRSRELSAAPGGTEFCNKGRQRCWRISRGLATPRKRSSMPSSAFWRCSPSRTAAARSRTRPVRCRSSLRSRSAAACCSFWRRACVATPPGGSSTPS